MVSWWNLVLLLMLVAGNCELWVTLVNRLHALPWRRGVLRWVRRAHDVGMVLFPILLFALVGFGGPRLIWGGRWTDLAWPWRIYLGLCAAGFVGLCFSAVRWWLYRPPAQLQESRSEIIDIARRLGYRPVGNGPHRSYLDVRGNQILQLERAEKVFALPRLPAAWDGLSILHLSDFHFIGSLSRPFFEEAMALAAEQPADLIVFTGDLADDLRLLDWLPTTLGRLDAPLGRYFILGNHDWAYGPQEIRRRVAELGWTDVAGQVVMREHRGATLAIGGTERPWMGRHPDFSTAPADAFRLLLSHTPDHFGWAQRQRVDLMLSGHNHGGQVVLPVIGPVYAPSRYGVKYASGTFWRDPTLLHVSRGLAGKHPLRIRCRPEVTRLVLRTA